MPVYFKKTIKWVFTAFVISLLFAFSTLWYFSSDLPDYKILANYKPPVSSRVHSNEGQLIAEFALQKRLFVPYDTIPDKIIYSFLSAEDKNFFSHPGVDAKSITRAIIKNLKNYFSEKRLEGASTITQQVAKNFLLTNEVSLKRKIKEAILAFRIERAYSKERIMELYLNQIYLGEGTYGIAAASLEYFDKAVNDLTYEEAALLAALPKAPSKYNPYKSIERAKIRRDIVLKNLFENSYITEKKYKELKNKKIITSKRKIELLEEANFYSEEVRRIVNDNYGYDALYKGGLSIRTPLNSNYQIKALKALRDGLEEYDRRHGWRGPITNLKEEEWINNIKKFSPDKSLNWKLAKVIDVKKLNLKIETEDKEIGFIDFNNIRWTRKKSFEEFLKLNDIIYVSRIKKNKWNLKQLPKINGAIVVMDPYTGRVLSMAGGFSFKLSEFNRATQAKRQPGSAFKPIVYAAALENGFTPSTLVLDAPFVMDQGVGLKTWKPENYGKKFYGPSTLRTGIEKSRNLMTVRIAQKVGFEQISKATKNFGIYDDVPELLSVSLGAAETTLIQLTNAYCTFVNGGKKVTPIFIDRIQDRRGKTTFNADKRKCIGCEKISYLKDDEVPKIENTKQQIISPETAYQITSMLEGVIKRGTGRKLKDLNLTLAGKTGTTNKNMDAWFLGFTSKLVIGVYVGFDEPKTLGKYETGAKAALPVFKKFVSQAVKKKESLPFAVPKTISLTVVDAETGLRPNADTKTIIYESFKTTDNILFGIEDLSDKNKLEAYDSKKDKIILEFY